MVIDKILCVFIVALLCKHLFKCFGVARYHDSMVFISLVFVMLSSFQVIVRIWWS